MTDPSIDSLPRADLEAKVTRLRARGEADANGLDLACTVRRRWPAVLTSGYSNVLAQEGAHGFELLRRPYSANELSHALQAATDAGTEDLPS